AGVDAAVGDFAPDVLLVDQQALAGAFVARRRDIPYATLATTSAGVTDPLGGLPKVREWVDAQICALQGELGLPADARPDATHAWTVARRGCSCARRRRWPVCATTRQRCASSAPPSPIARTRRPFPLSCSASARACW